MTTESRCFFGAFLVLFVMLVGSNYQLVEQRKHNELIIKQAEHILIVSKMLQDRQDELKISLAASERERMKLLILWENINPKYREGPDEAVVMDEE